MAIDNVEVIKIVQLAIFKVQATLWKPHHHSPICWCFFVVNDNLPINIVNPYLLKYIIYRYEQTNENLLIKNYFMFKKRFINYNKCNGVTLMKAHIGYAHSKLFVVRKL
jgi:hypothetical protein